MITEESKDIVPGPGTKNASTLKKFRDFVFFHGRHNVLVDKKIRSIESLENLWGNDPRLLTEEKVTSLVRLAVKKSSFYRELYSNIDFRKPFEEWFADLPVINKASVRMHAREMATIPVSLLKAAQTSGTSGTPLTVYRSAGSILRENAYTWRFRISHGLNIGDPTISLRATLDKNTMHSYNRSENILYLSSYQLSEKNTPFYANMIAHFRPKAILAFPSSVFTLAGLLERAGMASSIPLIFTSSESLYDFQREKIEQVFGGRVFDYYGNAERTIAYGQCAFGHYHEIPLYAYNQFNHFGVVTTGLTNYAFPLIKYAVDDRFIREAGTCACGKSLQVRKIEGRSDDVIKSREGTLVTGMSLSFRGIKGLDYAQIIQEELGSIQVNIVTNLNFTSNDEKTMVCQLKNRLSDSLEIRVKQIREEEIVRAPSGKFKLVISYLG